MSLRPLRVALETWAPGRGIAAEPLHRIGAAWAEIVGADVAAHSEPLELSGRTLLIATRSSAWSQQLQLLSPAILRAVAALPEAANVKRLAFRSMPPRSARAVRGGTREREARDAPPGHLGRERGALGEPATDANEALARLRRRVEAVRRGASRSCEGCGAPLEGRAGRACAPCAGEAERARRLTLERAIYVAPWLTHAELRAQVPDLSGAEFERARRRLLARWWLILERARLAKKVSPAGLERRLASSYVLLQSRLPPDRITPAVVANLLGEDLVRALRPPETRPPEPGRPRPFGE